MIYQTTEQRVSELRIQFRVMIEMATVQEEDWSTISGTELDQLLMKLHRLPHTRSHEALRDEILEVRSQCSKLPGFRSELQRGSQVPVPA